MTPEDLGDITLNQDRYIRMPAKMLYVFVAGLVLATYAYFDVRTQTLEATRLGKENAQELNALVTKFEVIRYEQGKRGQEMDDFIKSSQIMYDKYFRSFTDPDYRNRK